MGTGELLVVRNANKQVYKRFRQKAIAEDISIGAALNEAMEYWINIKNSGKKPDPRKLLKARSVDLGPDSKNLSTTIDEVLYG